MTDDKKRTEENGATKERDAEAVARTSDFAEPAAGPDAAATAAETVVSESASDEPPVAADGGDVEPAAEEVTGPSPEEELVQLREETAKLRDQALRAMAEAENTRRRVMREKEDTARYAIAGFARDLLATADNLRRALDAIPEEARQADAVLAAMVDGVAASEKEMLSTFEKHGITKLDPSGQKFDPNYHQAMFEADNSGQVPGTVVQVLQAGYVLNGRLLRPAMVAVAKGEAPKKVDTVA